MLLWTTQSTSSISPALTLLIRKTRKIHNLIKGGEHDCDRRLAGLLGCLRRPRGDPRSAHHAEWRRQLHLCMVVTL